MRSGWMNAFMPRRGVGFAVAVLLTASAAAPALAQERLEQDFGLIKACAGDVWSLCADVLPDVGRMKECMQSKIGQLPRPCLDKLLDSMAGSSFKVCKDQTYALCAAARCNVYNGVAYSNARRSTATASACRFRWAKGSMSARSTRRAPITNTW